MTQMDRQSFMKSFWRALLPLPQLLSLPTPDTSLYLDRVRYMERNIVLPVKALMLLVLFYYLYYSRWLGEIRPTLDPVQNVPPHEIALDIIRQSFLAYLVVNTALFGAFLWRPPISNFWLERVILVDVLIDSLFFASFAVIAGGFNSVLFYVFLGLMLRNAITIPPTPRLLVLNIVVGFGYLLAGGVELLVNEWLTDMTDIFVQQALEQGTAENPGEPFFLRLTLLSLMTICCYAVPVWLAKQRRAEEEAREYQSRQQQLQATGRLAAEIAHQLKNPLGIINNAAFTLQRTVKEGKTITQQILMIREEVERSDRILTELMGYARLTEGKVEKLDVAEELDRAIEQVFPHAAKYDIQINRSYASALPPLLMQRSHLSEVFMNLLINAREALEGKGMVSVTTSYGEDYSVVVLVSDDGPGIPTAKLPLVFEPYYTTKVKGTGLGLAIVKHNTEIYGGNVKVESELGKGTTFTIVLPAKTVMKLRK